MYATGIGLRRSLLADVVAQPNLVGFWEVAPENWITQPDHVQDKLSAIADVTPLTAHGLSLSIGSPDPLDEKFLTQLKQFLDRFDINLYSEHLSFCSANGHLYDLLPMPFTSEAVDYVAGRIKRVQDQLERPLVLENISYYTPLALDLTELEFINAVAEQADCKLLLDVNNVFVNSVNHSYNAKDFIAGLNSKRVVYGHIAGHYEQAPDLLIDTHGAPIKRQVYDLLDWAYQCHGVFPTVVERDFNIPDLATLRDEANQVHKIQNAAATEMA